MILQRAISIIFALVLMTFTPAVAQEDEDISDAAEELKKLLREAADSGYVSIRGDVANESDDSSTEATPRIGKGIPRSLRLGAEAPQKPPKSFCQMASMFSFEEYEDGPSYDDIFKLRSELTTIKGEYIPEVGAKLAKTYLAVALPEEAIALEEIFESKEVGLAARLAKALVGTGAGEVAAIEEYLACTDKAGLWVAAALSSTDREKALSYTEEYLYLMSELPPELEFSMATQLGIIAAEEERYDLAKSLLAKAKKQEKNSDAAVLFLESLIDSKKGEEAGIQQLQQLAQVQSPVQAKALLTLGDLSEESPYRAYAADLALVSAQYKDLSESQLAKLMNIRFLAEAGAFQKAVDTTLKEFPEFGPERTTARDSVGTSLLKRFREAEGEDRIETLDHYTKNFSFYLGFPDETNLRLAGSGTAIEYELPRLLDLFLNDYDFTSQQREYDLRRAQAALQIGQEDLAWSICSLYEGDAEFDQISVAAAINLEDAAAALAALSRLPQTEDIIAQSAQVAWSAGLWDDAKDYYAETLLTDASDGQNARHKLAAYMAGEQGGFFALETSEDLLKIEEISNSYTEEKAVLMEYLGNG